MITMPVAQPTDFAIHAEHPAREIAIRLYGRFRFPESELLDRLRNPPHRTAQQSPMLCEQRVCLVAGTFWDVVSVKFRTHAGIVLSKCFFHTPSSDFIIQSDRPSGWHRPSACEPM